MKGKIKEMNQTTIISMEIISKPKLIYHPSPEQIKKTKI
jgi:hypothetical protein